MVLLLPLPLALPLCFRLAVRRQEARSAAGRGVVSCLPSPAPSAVPFHLISSRLASSESASIRGFAFCAAKLKVIFKDLSRICSIIVGILTPQEDASSSCPAFPPPPFFNVVFLYFISVLDSDYKLILIRVIYIAATYRTVSSPPSLPLSATFSALSVYHTTPLTRPCLGQSFELPRVIKLSRVYRVR